MFAELAKMASLDNLVASLDPEHFPLLLVLLSSSFGACLGISLVLFNTVCANSVKAYAANLQKRILSYPNGPSTIPLVGNIGTFAKLQRRPDQELLRIAKQYGDLCMLWFGSNPVVIVSSPETAKDLMDKKGANFSSRPAQNDFRASAWPWRLVTTPTGETFRLLRRLYHNLLGPQQSAQFRKYQDFESIQMINDLLDKPEGFLGGVERFAMSVIFSATYGFRLAHLEHPTMVQFYGIWEEMLRYFQPGSLLLDYFPVLARLPHALQPWRKLAVSLRKTETRLNIAFLRKLKEQINDGRAPDCFGTNLIKVQEEEGISDERACDILAMLVGAGADTTSSYLQSFFKVMALHPEVIRKAQAELDDVVGSKRLPVWDDEMKLPYVRAVIKEVHRWAPIGSLGIPHATLEDDEYLGRRIPGNTIVFPNLTALSRSPERYEEPESFEPERFLGDTLDASASALHPDYRKRDHFHYGFGRRLCQGIFVAEASLYIVVSRVLWGFDIQSKRGATPLDMSAKIAGLVTKPKPYEINITCRSPVHEATMRRAHKAATTDILDFDAVELDR